MQFDTPRTRLPIWLRERRRRNAPGIRQVYTSRNVVNLAHWRWAKAAQRAEMARDRLRLATAQAMTEEAAHIERVRSLIAFIVAAITSDVLAANGRDDLADKKRPRGHRKPRKPSKKF